ncbi:uncharacterized protein EHS24_008111 [Apiotrichum porosum]|uniref:Uncharacterized protein n=1 Tax=Apiotrichum porosum TaxID=105984 RepID=A0A427XSV0_9TREE|nr:uncharacterized protein EHS24_008111 [Apiotrichum porosum]RSH81914.1 hypothetical protein EHS24_008111 [Apiotrichum porosum]
MSARGSLTVGSVADLGRRPDSPNVNVPASTLRAKSTTGVSDQWRLADGMAPAEASVRRYTGRPSSPTCS